jgi:hypothetical protein
LCGSDGGLKIIHLTQSAMMLLRRSSVISDLMILWHDIDRFGKFGNHLNDSHHWSLSVINPAG